MSLSSVVAACSFAPAYESPPVAPPPTALYQELGEWKLAEPLDAAPRGTWWTVFEDPQLNALEARVGDANQNLKAAIARLQQARAESRIQRAGLLPTLNVGSSAARGRTSLNSATYVSGRNPAYDNLEFEADLSYELDLWGRVRNSVNSAKASQQASAADLATLDLSIRAELAADYFQLRGADAQQQLLEQTVEDYRKSLELTQHLYEGGDAVLADVEQAKAQLQSARTQAAETHLLRSQSEHAIGVLVGENPSGFRLAVDPLPLGLDPPEIDPGLPSALLERRPDVAGAERRVAAANFNVGVARAAYFPQFSLAATVGYDSVHSSNWLDAPSRIWSAGPTGLLTVFDAGRHRAESAQAHAMFDEQVADYRNIVLTAYRDVEDNLAALRLLQEESVSEAEAVAATGNALQQARYRYKAGLVTYLEVAASETTNLQARLSHLNIQIRRMNASVLLIKALGGGWQQHGPMSAADLYTKEQSPGPIRARRAAGIHQNLRNT
jgi:NodT family efflux transporter outer membrane factor (OMF) lipoprotein